MKIDSIFFIFNDFLKNSSFIHSRARTGGSINIITMARQAKARGKPAGSDCNMENGTEACVQKSVGDKIKARSSVLGDDLRNLRKQKGHTIESLSRLAGVSTGVISQVERNLTAPTLRTLYAITAALDVPMGWLFDEGGDQHGKDADLVVRGRNRRKMIVEGRGIVQEILTPRFSGNLQMILVTVSPDGGSGRDGYAHEGEEAGFLISGELDLTVGETSMHLRAGDSFKFESNIPHSFHNPSATDAVIVWVTSPPMW